MRMILVDHARASRAQKRGGGCERILLDDAPVSIDDRFEGLLDLENALTELASVDSRKSQIIKLRFFGGLSPEAIAELLGVSAPTVFRELKIAKAWLRRRLS
jgi:RNA polymerase sigma factor (TIGR02999 family)